MFWFLTSIVIGTNPAQAADKMIYNISAGSVPPDVVITTGQTRVKSLPVDIYQDPERGPQSVQIESYIPAGVYELTIGYRTPEKPSNLLVMADDKLQSIYETFRFDKPGTLQKYSYIFRIDDSLRHTISIGIAPIAPVLYPSLAGSICIESVSLASCTPRPAPPGPQGRPCVDLWGWMGCINYQRAKPATLDYMKTATIDEPWKWGANFVQTFPHFFEPDWQKAWTQDEIDDYARHSHERGFLVDVHGFSPVDPDKLMERVKLWSRTDGNLLLKGWQSVVDTWENEPPGIAVAAAGEDYAIALHDVLWLANPGTPFNQCNERPNTWQASMSDRSKDWDCVTYYKGPNFIKTTMCAAWMRLGKHIFPTLVYTDKTPIRIYPGALGLDNGSRSMFLGYQADSRLLSYSPGGPDGYGGIFGGGTTPDLILKQADDFFRPRVKDPDNVHESAIWWLGETPEILPVDLRSSVYAASMDPVRRAFTASLAATGFDGSIARRRELFEEVSGEKADCPWSLHDGEPYPASTVFIQNNFFRLLRFAGGDFGILQFDPEHTAHFDSNSTSVELASLVGSEPMDGWRTLTEEAVTPVKLDIHSASECCTLALDFGDPERAATVDVVVDGRKQASIRVTKGARFVPLDLAAAGEHRIELSASYGGPVRFKSIKVADEQIVRGKALFHLEAYNQAASQPKAVTIDLANGSVPLPKELAKAVDGAAERVRVVFNAPEGNYVLRIRAGAADSAGIRVYRDSFKAAHRYSAADGYELKYGTCGFIRIGSKLRTYSVPVDLNYNGKHTLEIEVIEGSCSLQSLELVPSAVVHRFIERGGHRAVLEEILTRSGDDGKVAQTRRYTVDNDAPWLRMDVTRRGTRSVWSLRLMVPGYNRLVAGTTSRTRSASVAPNKALKLLDGRGILPELILLIPHPNRISKINWQKGESLELVFPEETVTSSVFFLVPGTCKDEELPELAAALSENEPAVKLAETGKGTRVIIKPVGRMAKTVRVLNPSEGPYLVRENGWWHARGGQPSSQTPGVDYLKLYPGRGDVLIQPADYIDGTVRPGWGCQYLLAIRDVERSEGSAACTVKVTSATAYIFAPRVEFAEPFTRVKLDGIDWPYFDERFVFLPTRPGTYRVEVQSSDEPIPHLICTSGMLLEGSWDKARLSLKLKVGLQPWARSIPEKQHFYALIRNEGYETLAIDGAEKVDPGLLGLSEQQKESMSQQGFAVRFHPATEGDPTAGAFTVKFKKRD